MDARITQENDRRCALIGKRREAGMTGEERAERDRLQPALDARLEAVGLRRIARAEKMLAAMKGRRSEVKA